MTTTDRNASEKDVRFLLRIEDADNHGLIKYTRAVLLQAEIFEFQMHDTALYAKPVNPAG